MLELIGLLVGMRRDCSSPGPSQASGRSMWPQGCWAALDSALGGFRSRLKGEFKLEIFLSGTLGNAGIAAFLTWLVSAWGCPSIWPP